MRNIETDRKNYFLSVSIFKAIVSRHFKKLEGQIKDIVLTPISLVKP